MRILKTSLLIGALTLSTLSALSIFTPLANAQPAAKTAKTNLNHGPVVNLMLSPQAQPERALKYRLLPTVYEQQAGNAAVTYLMAAGALPKDAWPEEYDDWLDGPLDKFPVKKVAQAVAGGGDLNLLHGGARRMRVEWDVTNIRENGVAALLPHIQHLRTLARRLALRIRMNVKQQQFDDAIEDIKTGLALGHHLESGSTILESLVGIAICSTMCDRLEELIQQPGAPNLFWALAELPRPLVDMRQGLSYEQYWLQFMIKQSLVKQVDAPLAMQYEPLTSGLVNVLSIATNDFMADTTSRSEAKVKARLSAAGMVIYAYPRAKRYFIEKKGMTAEEVDKLPVTNVAMQYELEQFSYWRDEMFKWFALPYWQAAEHYQESEQRFVTAAEKKETGMLASIMLPALGSAKRAEVRLDRRIAALQTVEALRMHAAKHGQWPDSLASLDVPVPLDPFTGQPFTYGVKDGNATLQGAVPNGGREQDAINYRIGLRK